MIVVGGVALELLASSTTKDLAGDHRTVAVVLVAVIGAGFHGLVLGRWQWRILVTRMPGLPRRQWVIATLVPALVVWLLAIAPGAVDILAQGGDTLAAFKNGFIQAIVLGPLVGLSQATALRDHTTRWMWWFAANLTTYLLGVGGLRVRQAGVGHPLALDADHRSVPAARIPDLPGVDAVGDRTRGHRHGRPATGTARSTPHRRPRHPGLETERGEERHEHCTIHPGLFQSRAPSARRHRTAPILGDRDRSGRGLLPVAAGPLVRCFAGGVPGGRAAALTGIAAYQVRAIIRHRHSAVRAIEALAITVPLFLLLFAATYFLMAQADADNFNVHSLTRTDSLYFTITVFATVGFGDISATSQAARIAVMVQMILDLLVLGLLVKVFQQSLCPSASTTSTYAIIARQAAFTMMVLINFNLIVPTAGRWD